MYEYDVTHYEPVVMSFSDRWPCLVRYCIAVEPRASLMKCDRVATVQLTALPAVMRPMLRFALLSSSQYLHPDP